MPTLAKTRFSPPTMANDKLAIEQIYRFRVRVWRESGTLAETAFPDGQWSDRFDATARHWIVRDVVSGRIVAAARLNVVDAIEQLDEPDEYRRYGLRFDGRIAAPARVVVCPATQGCGLATQLLDVQDAAARDEGAVVAVRQASPGMVRLLSRRGWSIHGPASSDPRFPNTSFHVATKDL